MEIRESMEDDQMREFMRDLFASADPDDDDAGNFAHLERASVEDVRPDNPDTPEREFIRALFDNSDED